jgi:hypothetical protein
MTRVTAVIKWEKENCSPYYNYLSCGWDYEELWDGSNVESEVFLLELKIKLCVCMCVCVCVCVCARARAHPL